MKQTKRAAALWGGVVALGALIVGAGATLLLLAVPARATAAAAGSAERLDPQLMAWAFLGAALSTGLAALAAGYAVGRVGSAAVGAIAEKPELFGRALVLVGLAEGIAIYGLIVSILILNRIA
ncbi:MAG: ATP synthase subunit C [Steroidobacteraceae bacterium]